MTYHLLALAQQTCAEQLLGATGPGPEIEEPAAWPPSAQSGSQGDARGPWRASED